MIIGTFEVGPASPVGAENMVEGKDMAVIQGLRCLRIVANRHGIRANFSLWKNDAYLHFCLLSKVLRCFSDVKDR